MVALPLLVGVPAPSTTIWVGDPDGTELVTEAKTGLSLVKNPLVGIAEIIVGSVVFVAKGIRLGDALAIFGKNVGAVVVDTDSTDGEPVVSKEGEVVADEGTPVASTAGSKFGEADLSQSHLSHWDSGSMSR